MPADKIPIEAIIRSLDEHMKVTRSLDLALATQLLAMAKLDLQMALHDVDDFELRELIDAIGEHGHGTAAAPDFSAKPQTLAIHNENRPATATRPSRHRRASSATALFEPGSAAPRNRGRRSGLRPRQRP